MGKLLPLISGSLRYLLQGCITEEDGAMTVGLKINPDVELCRFVVQMFHACWNACHRNFLWEQVFFIYF